MTINIGIIGFGFIGHIHEQSLADRNQMKVIAICDIDSEKMNDSITKNVIKTTSVDELLKIKTIDTVIVSVFNDAHKEVVIKAAIAGKNIICEKPAAMNVSEFDEMMAVVNEKKVKFTVHQQRRLDNDFRTAKKVYEKKELGNIYTVQSKLYGLNGNMHDWHIYKKHGGGMLYDWGVHLIDQMLYMIDSKIISIFADVRNVINEEVDDYFKILLEFENGIMGEIELGTYYLTDKPHWFERHWFIGGDKGSMYSDGFIPEGKVVKTSRLLENVPGKTVMTASGPTRSFGTVADGILMTEELPVTNYNYQMFYDNYVNTLQGTDDFLVKQSEVRRVLSVMQAVRESGLKKESIKFKNGL
ncbi:Gfo/Idh/MocA family protein [Vagococcus elongatus]|uniref:Oxidoreductase n=1 Tax=Vagococcus elongatus TaxID=180344 RepID=A0A430AR20_9ENTE|nr:Gfo/Idh/MocA family oxidoreductase [Vagococcus elongatus]RSU10506.1 oxidoreductase [Vagococcus elongatus]